MTTFEITIIVLLAVIVVLLIIAFIGMATINARMKEGFKYLGKKVEYCDSKLGYIKGTAQDILQQLDNIEDNILDDLRDIHINHDKPFELPPNWPWASCYLPNGNCPNPQRDCINCPRRGDGGSWSTSTNKINEDRL